MIGEERRSLILNELENVEGPISATTLAKKFSVTRQIIVADIALLRASGSLIRAEHKGYVFEKPYGSAIQKKIVCAHDKDGIRDELYAVVDNGGAVLDVVVEHSLYGAISAQLGISTRYGVDEFISRAESTGASQLSDLTGGIHIHTIAVNDEETFARICAKLDELGVLIET